MNHPMSSNVTRYNGHPLGNHVDLKLEHVKDVVIYGLGNVALDCARILLKDPVKDLHPTGIPSCAAEDLKHHMIGNLKWCYPQRSITTKSS